MERKRAEREMYRIGIFMYENLMRLDPRKMWMVEKMRLDTLAAAIGMDFIGPDVRQDLKKSAKAALSDSWDLTRPPDVKDVRWDWAIDMEDECNDEGCDSCQ